MRRRKRSRWFASFGGCDRKDDQGEAVFDASSLVDVGFLLLIYFLVTSTLLPKEADLGVDLLGEPNPTSVPIKLPPVKVEVSGEGSVSVGGQVLDTPDSGRQLPGLLKELKPYVSATVAMETEAAVVLFAANEASQQRLVDVLNTITKAGITNVTLDSGWYE